MKHLRGLAEPICSEHVSGASICIRMRNWIWVFAVLLIGSFACAGAVGTLPSVPTERRAVTNTYHGSSVTDDYQWLEDAKAPEVREWMRLQNERTRAYF